MILQIYRSLTYLAYPFVWGLLRYRRSIGKEDILRACERRGRPQKQRPTERLIWLHGASVGECLSMMPFVNYLVKLPHTKVMITSGTTTSAELMAKRLPEGAFHQYMPVDLPTYTKRFVSHWKPDLVFFFESDFWPNMLIDIHRKKIPLILLNGRISDKSFKRWQKFPFFIKPLLRLFTFGLGQTDLDAMRMQKLGFAKTDCVGNIKFSAVPAPFNQEELQTMKKAIGNRFVWVAGSTHDNEEEQAIHIHLQLQKIYPTLLTVIAPRHPNRAEEICKMITSYGLSVHRRSCQENLNADVYLADTIGEMGLVYRLSPLVFVGGSLIAFGGQNMLEPMRIGACTIIGPHAFNFKEIVRKAKEKEALIEVEDEKQLFETLKQMSQNLPKRLQIAYAGQQLATSETAVLDRVVKILEPFLENT